MHKRRLNHARLSISLRPRGPILVKSGLETPDPTRPGMEFVRTRHSHYGETIYLPGTSLKGAIRSHSERILRGMSIEICDPLDRYKRCAPGKNATSEQICRHLCAACRTFGSLHLSGRVNLLDAYPWSLDSGTDGQQEAVAVANATETRWQVGIDRETSQTHKGSLYDLEVMVKGELHTEVQLHNFQLWQLGLVAAVLRDMNEGQVPIGFGKARGLGQMEVVPQSLRVTMCARETRRLLGVAELCSDDERSAYDLHPHDAIELEGVTATPSWPGVGFEVEGKAVGSILQNVVEGPLTSFVDHRRRQAGARGR